MAKNLRAKIPKEDTLTVFDVNAASTKRLTEESEAKVNVATSPKEVAEMSVCV
jgi:3-hydroxyisobutyrate/3-hydroxypropionate dehydrogenase